MLAYCAVSFPLGRLAVEKVVIGLSVYRCLAAGIRQRTTACERCSVLRTRPNLSYPLQRWVLLSAWRCGTHTAGAAQPRPRTPRATTSVHAVLFGLYQG